MEHFLGCWGRKCNKYERHYSSAKGELLGEVHEEVGAHIEVPAPFLVNTDAASLKYNVNLKAEEKRRSLQVISNDPLCTNSLILCLLIFLF